VIKERGGRVNRGTLMRALKHRYRNQELEGAIKSLVEAGRQLRGK
jgi:hypothetical protein